MKPSLDCYQQKTGKGIRPGKNTFYSIYDSIIAPSVRPIRIHHVMNRNTYCICYKATVIDERDKERSLAPTGLHRTHYVLLYCMFPLFFQAACERLKIKTN